MGALDLLRGHSNSVDLPLFKFTAGCAIETMPLPEKVVLPLISYGTEYTPSVKKGEKVLAGQVIANCENPVMPPFYATISGEVGGTIKYVDPIYDAVVNAVVINSDGQDTWEDPGKPCGIKASAERMIEQIRKATLSGLGGAGFPLYVKLLSARNFGVDWLIINAMECEPYITADYRLMLENAVDIINGIKVLEKILRPDHIVIAINADYTVAVEHMRAVGAGNGLGDGFSVRSISRNHPAGAEELLVRAILGRDVPKNKLPQDVGATVHNISTLKAITDAITTGKPLHDRVVTVTGKVKRRANVRVRIGTPASAVLDYCGGMDDDASRLVLGGPMTGLAASSPDNPVTTRVNCLLAMRGESRSESSCIRCGRCVSVCPVGLSPVDLFQLSRAGRYQDCLKEHIEVCFDCGNCSYVCPSAIPLVQYIKIAKREIKLRGITESGE